MVWRCLGGGAAATVAAYAAALVIDWLTPFGRWIIFILAVPFAIGMARWGASRSTSPMQGAVHGALTMVVPAVFATGLFLLLQYEWGGPGVFNVDHLYASLILLGVPLLFGAVVGAVVGHSKAQKSSAP